MFPAQAPQYPALPPPPTPADYIVTHRERHRVHTGPLYGELKTVHTVPKGVYGQGHRMYSTWPAAGWCMLSAPPARSKQPTLRIATCQAQLLSEARPAPPNCPPKLLPRPITGYAKSYRCACHWTAAAGHHAIPAAMWTVSLVKSNHLSGKQPGLAPPWETMFRCGSSAGWPGRVWEKCRSLYTLV